MANNNYTHDGRQAIAVVPLVMMFALWGTGLFVWSRTGDVVTLIFFFYIGLFLGATIGGYIGVPDRDRPDMRRAVMLMMGGMLLVAAFATDHGNMQIEGLFFALLGGVGSFVIIHYLLAKIVGPLIFGRIWCGWACWFGMIFDILPYPYSRYRHDGQWGWVRVGHFALSFVIVAILVFGFDYVGGAEGSSGLVWFIVGLSLYYAVGIGMAFALKDNRAFCKYLCPIAVPMKATSRFSLLKIKARSTEGCANCETCVEMCPMNIRVKDYVVGGQRVLSTECTLCQTCINVCPKDALILTFGFDVTDREILDHEPDVKAQREKYAR
ncbi:MAG: 4Fe-4S binding protein [Chloroflexi bacterium]|nr:4Fe-4S binding protein [Chloroflexota bacterium]